MMFGHFFRRTKRLISMNVIIACMFLIFLSYLYWLDLPISRKKQSAGEKVLFHQYSGTSMDGMHQHLAKNHLDDWIGACDALGIAITADCAQPYVESYRNAHPESTKASPFVRTDPEDVPSSFGAYSHEGLANYCMLWIVADDQVLNIPTQL